MTADLIAFITARLDEDEQAARAVGMPDIWRADSSWAAELLNPLPSQRQAHPGYVPMITQADLDHIARHDPARVLREVEAKRRIIEAAEEASGLDIQVDGSFRVGRRDTTAEPYIGDVILRALAAAWSDHPDYRQEWAP